MEKISLNKNYINLAELKVIKKNIWCLLWKLLKEMSSFSLVVLK